MTLASAYKELSLSNGDLLEVLDLKVGYIGEAGMVTVVDGISFRLAPGQTMAIVGESGSGKSTAAKALAGLLPGNARILGGRAMLRGLDLTSLREPEWRPLRGKRVAMVLQDVLSCLHPMYTVGWQIAEVLKLHDPHLSKSQIRKRVTDLMDLVHISSPDKRIDQYPHEFSGGMRQRVMIALAIALNPSLLIADEPTTALDVTVQAQIMDLLDELQRDLQMGMVLITHDLSLVREVSDHVSVMYGGRFVEQGETEAVFADPSHAYTLGLLSSRPSLHQRRLVPIPGTPPDPRALPPGCSFFPRCSFAEDDCRLDVPGPRALGRGHSASCYHTDKVRTAAGSTIK